MVTTIQIKTREIFRSRILEDVQDEDKSFLVCAKASTMFVHVAYPVVRLIKETRFKNYLRTEATRLCGIGCWNICVSFVIVRIKAGIKVNEMNGGKKLRACKNVRICGSFSVAVFCFSSLAFFSILSFVRAAFMCECCVSSEKKVFNSLDNGLQIKNICTRQSERQSRGNNHNNNQAKTLRFHQICGKSSFSRFCFSAFANILSATATAASSEKRNKPNTFSFKYVKASWVSMRWRAGKCQNLVHMYMYV